MKFHCEETSDLLDKLIQLKNKKIISIAVSRYDDNGRGSLTAKHWIILYTDDSL